MVPSGGRLRGWPRLGLLLVVLAIFAYQSWQERQRPAVRQPETEPANSGVVEREERPNPQIIHNDYVQPAEAGGTPAVARSPATKITADPVRDDRERPRTVISSQTIRDQDGRVIFRGDVDVGATIARIERGDRMRFPNDGVVFQNRERRLPRKSAGYYREFVHPTPGENGPGPQRIVTGEEGELYYTPDHYRTFQRLDRP